MGIRYRKGINMGPLRINFSKSGVGVSAGVKGFRVTKKAGGGVRTTASIPGIGISSVHDYSGKKSGRKRGKLKWVLIGLAALIIIGIAVDSPNDPNADQEENTLDASTSVVQQDQPASSDVGLQDVQDQVPPVDSSALTQRPQETKITYIGNKNSLKFHVPTCSTIKNMAEDNRVDLESLDAAIAQGFEPCGRCLD